MAFEDKAGLGVHNHYGPRTSGGVAGPDNSQGNEKKFVWFYDTAASGLYDQFLIPTGSIVTGVTGPAGITAVTVGGTAVTDATEVAPVEASGAVAVTGATDGDVVFIKYVHFADPIELD